MFPFLSSQSHEILIICPEEVRPCSMQYVLLWNGSKILFSYFNVSLVISRLDVQFLCMNAIFVQWAQSSSDAKAGVQHTDGGGEAFRRSCWLLCLPRLLVAITTTTWFVFPPAHQYLCTEMKGCFGEGFSFTYSCDMQHGPINYSFHGTEEVREGNEAS